MSKTEMSNYHRAPQGAPVYDPYELGAAGRPYSTQADNLPIPAGATGRYSILSGSRRAM
jgi:hypothetical protein